MPVAGSYKWPYKRSICFLLEQITTNWGTQNSTTLLLHSSEAQKSEIFVTGLKSRCWLGHTPSGGPGGTCPLLLPASGCATSLAVAASFQSLPSPLCSPVVPPASFLLGHWWWHAGPTWIMQGNLLISRSLITFPRTLLPTPNLSNIYRF